MTYLKSISKPFMEVNFNVIGSAALKKNQTAHIYTHAKVFKLKSDTSFLNVRW